MSGYISTSILLLVLAYASISDIRTHRIPNWLCLVALCCGLVLQLVDKDGSGAWGMAASVFVPAVIFLPFYIGGGMAAGDVKLMCGCGALLGWPLAMIAAAYTLLLGSVLGIIVYIVRGGWPDFSERYVTAARVLVSTGRLFLDRAASGSVAKSRFPYAVAIAAGCIGSLLFPVLG